MTTRNLIKFAAIFMLCLTGGLAVTLFRIVGPDGLDLANPKVLFHSGSRSAYFRNKQWLADAQTLVWAVRYWFEPERAASSMALPGLHTGLPTNTIVASAGRRSAIGGIISTSAPAAFDFVPARAAGAVGAIFGGGTEAVKIEAVSGGAFSATPNG